jgi:hypothetical protein
LQGNSATVQPMEQNSHEFVPGTNRTGPSRYLWLH